MTDDTNRWLLVPRPLRRLPADLVAVVFLIVVTNITVFAPILEETPLRVVFGLVFVLFLPGYAFIAALFPENLVRPLKMSQLSRMTPRTRRTAAAYSHETVSTASSG